MSEAGRGTGGHSFVVEQAHLPSESAVFSALQKFQGLEKEYASCSDAEAAGQAENECMIPSIPFSSKKEFSPGSASDRVIELVPLEHLTGGVDCAQVCENEMQDP